MLQQFLHIVSFFFLFAGIKIFEKLRFYMRGTLAVNSLKHCWVKTIQVSMGFKLTTLMQ